MDVRQRLARNLRRLRAEKGWSQERYADEAGIHRTYVSDIERGARNPTITVVEKLAAGFGLSAGKMLEQNSLGVFRPHPCHPAAHRSAHNSFRELNESEIRTLV